MHLDKGGTYSGYVNRDVDEGAKGWVWKSQDITNMSGSHLTVSVDKCHMKATCIQELWWHLIKTEK